jgi:two-component system, LuxR family, sensor histidine kinase DctS
MLAIMGVPICQKTLCQPRMTSLKQDTPADFALLRQHKRWGMERSRWTLVWLVGLLLLLLGSVVTLVLYLENFEREEEQRRRAADAQWLEQSVQFHFRRLADDLIVLAKQVSVLEDAPRQPSRHTVMVQGGLLWRQPGVIVSHGWISSSPRHPSNAQRTQRWQADWAVHPINAESLDSMREIARGLRRAAYAGPMLLPDASPTDVVWLAVPLYERGSFVGNYVAAISMSRAVQALVPDWFHQSQSVRLLLEGSEFLQSGPQSNSLYRASMNLPGVDLFLEVVPRETQHATVPRIFFLVAVLFLTGMLVSLYMLRRDFEKRQRIQAQLQAEVALRTAMENSATIGLRAWDMNGKILYVNEAFCRMVGYRDTELLGKSAPLPYWPADQMSELHLIHRTIIAQGTRGEGVEVQFQHRDGHLVDVLIHEAPLNTLNAEQLGWMSSVQDISERKRALRMAAKQQEKLEASGRLVAVGEVASTLAHELNQPLGALSSFSSGLLNRLREGNITLHELEPVVARMVALAQRAGGIIQRVNAFARKREMSRHRMNLTPTVRRVLSGVTKPPVLQLSLQVLDGHEPLWVDADELLIEHLVSNLVGNAMDWAAVGGRSPAVRVELSHDDTQGMAVLVVSDSGPGVALEDHASIFNAFFSTKDGGMGMGLAICRSIVEAHHGRIDVDSDPDLKGARFTVYLPLVPLRTVTTDSQE